MQLFQKFMLQTNLLKNNPDKGICLEFHPVAEPPVDHWGIPCEDYFRWRFGVLSLASRSS